MTSKISVKAETISYSYVTLHNAAFYELREAKETEEGRFFHCLSVMLYSAFSIEAYLNHLGKAEISDWEKIERGYSPRQKLKMLVERKKFLPDFTKSPFDTFDNMFNLRKKIVHGKTERVQVEEIREGKLGETPDLPTTDWEKSTTLEIAALFYENSTSMIVLLHPIFGYTKDPFSTEWIRSWEVKPFGNIA
jgi:hypothetical protein